MLKNTKEHPVVILIGSLIVLELLTIFIIGGREVSFQHFMEVKWPMVLLSVFFMLIVVIALFGVTFNMLSRTQLEIETAIIETREAARLEREALSLKMQEKTEELQVGMSVHSDQVVKQVDEQQKKRQSDVKEEARG